MAGRAFKPLMRFIDSHIHLDFSEFDAQRQQCISEAQQVGIERFLVPGVSLAQSQALLPFAQQYPQCAIGAGLHPYFLEQHQGAHMAELAQLMCDNKQSYSVVGECGIDRSIANLDKQISLFEQHIELANELALPLVVHHRQSHDLIMQSFKRCQPKFGGVIHAFSGSPQVARTYIKQGFKLGVGGTITYERAKKTQQAIAEVGAEYLVLETDAPSMPLAGFQGQVNLPKRLVLVFDSLCEILNCSPAQREALSEQLYFNALALLRK